MSATERNVGMWKIPGRTSSLLLGGFRGVFWKERKAQTNWICSVWEPLLFEVKSVPRVSQRSEEKKGRGARCAIIQVLVLLHATFQLGVFFYALFPVGSFLLTRS